MTPEITIYGFETSNNMKVRVTLGYKEIPYVFNKIDPMDRDELVRLSGQHLTPVMLHGQSVLFDSAAILRYLDANFRDGPSLFGTSHREQWEIEDWELFARVTLAGPLMEVVHHRVHGGTVDDAMQARCAQAFADAATRLIEALEGREWLVGDRMTAADITAAAVMYRIRAAGLFEMPAGIESIGGWIDRVMAYDSYLTQA